MIHITCNMGSRDLPDMYALSPRALGMHIRQIEIGEFNIGKWWPYHTKAFLPTT